MNIPIRKSLSQLMVVVAILSPLACRKHSPLVAEVEGSPITRDVLNLYLSRQVPGSDPKAALDELVRLQVAWTQAERTGLLNGDEWREYGPKIRRQVLVKAYLLSQPGLPAPSEDALRSQYLAHNEQRHVLHLLVGSEEAAGAARKRVEKGESFEKVAAAVSIDPTASKNHGDIGWIGRNAVVPDFANAVFAVPASSLCGPFRTEFGWHVALVKECRGANAEDFEKEKGRLLEQAKEAALKPMHEDAAKRLRGKYNLKVDETVLALMPTEASAEADGRKVVGKVCGESITLHELLVFIKEAMGPGGMDHGQSANTRRRFLELLADDYRLTAAAEKAGIEKKPEVQASLWLAQHQAVRNGYGRTYLLKLKPADADLAAYHQAHADKFKDVGAVKVYLLVALDSTAAANAASEGRKGTAWKSLVTRYANMDSTGIWDPGFLAIADLKKVLAPDAVAALAAAPIGSLIGPVEGPEGPMLFKILDRKPGEVIPLDQCREQVRMAYLETEQEKLLQAYLDGEGRQGLKIRFFPENMKP